MKEHTQVRGTVGILLYYLLCPGETKILALRHRVGETLRRAASRGEEPPDVSNRTRWVDPLASFDKEGIFKWNDDLVSKLEKLCKKPKPPGPRR